MPGPLRVQNRGSDSDSDDGDDRYSSRRYQRPSRSPAIPRLPTTAPPPRPLAIPSVPLSTISSPSTTENDESTLSTPPPTTPSNGEIHYPVRPQPKPPTATPDYGMRRPTVYILVTKDAEHYTRIDITGAEDGAAIKECIFTKAGIPPREQAHYSFYRTEFGASAIGEALTDDQLHQICKPDGTSHEYLKFFALHSASRHREPHNVLPPTGAVSPPPPPPLHPALPLVPPSPLNTSCRSRHGSVSSSSEHAQGYDADVDITEDERRLTLRPQPPPANISVSLPGPGFHAPHNSYSGTSARAHDPGSSRTNSPLPAPPSARSATPPPPSSPRFDGPPVRDRYGNAMPQPPPPPPPPLSPQRSNFPFPDDTTPNASLIPPFSSTIPANSAPMDSERDLFPKIASADGPLRYPRRLPPSGNSKPSSPAKEPRRRRHPQPLNDEENSLGPPFDPERSPESHDSPRNSPSSARSSRHQMSPSSARYKSGYTSSRINMNIPSAPRNPPPPIPSIPADHRPTSSRTAGVPIAAGWAVNWKPSGDGKRSDSKPLSSSNSYRGLAGAKSMDNLRSGSGSSRNGRSGQQPPPTPRHNRDSPRPYGESSAPLPPAVPRFETPVQRHPRPLPTGPSVGTSRIPGTAFPSSIIPSAAPSSSSSHAPAEPYPRPQSALGDTVASPTQKFPSRHLQSPTYGSESVDSGRSRGVSPIRLHPATIFSRSVPATSEPVAEPRNSVESSSSVSQSPPSPLNVNSRPARERLLSESGIYSNRGDTTFMPDDSQPMPSSSATLLSNYSSASSNDGTIVQPMDDDSDGSEGSIWNKKPDRRSKRGPLLKVQIESSSSSHAGSPVSVPSAHSGTTTTTTAASSATPSGKHPLPPVPSSGQSSLRSEESAPSQKARDRGSTFKDRGEETWAPRPPPEDVFEEMERYFPGHDIDKPVIEASSGGASPTEVLPPLPPPVAPLVPRKDKSKAHHKKSIRMAASDGLRKRVSVADPNQQPSTSVSRRATRFWGQKLEEVTTDQARNGFPSSPDSPSSTSPTFKWVRGELIGRGTYGRVYLALNATTGEMIAVKQVEIPQTASDLNDSRQLTVVQALKLESETLRYLDHPNIVQYLGYEETPSNLSIFLEYVPGGSIGSCLQRHGKFEEDVTKSFTAQILAGLEYLHSKNILHRDLKADNILVETSGVCKISDFGISKRTDNLSGGAHTALQGTVFWMAPEVINTQEKGYNSKIDIWSIGCVVLEMWAGLRPWVGNEAMAVMFKLYHEKKPPPVPDDVKLSALGDDFRRKCFAINPEDRPSAAELRKHPYLILPPGWSFNGFSVIS